MSSALFAELKPFLAKRGTSKSDIKRDVFGSDELASGAMRVVRRAPTASQGDLMPPRDPGDPRQRLEGVRVVADDAGVMLHGYNNVERDPTSATGYRVRGDTGMTLLGMLLSRVRRCFSAHIGVHTYILRMDLSGMTPDAKRHVQADRTEANLARLNKLQVKQIEWEEGDAIPRIVARNVILPPWIAVCANRALYRVVCAQLFALMLHEYRPPAGCRVILDALDLCVMAPDSLDAWCATDRVQLSEHGARVVGEARQQLRNATERHWRRETARIASRLAHQGHLRSVPVCLETDMQGRTYAPFALPNAANSCGEADIGLFFWADAMRRERQHVTLAGCRAHNRPVVVPQAIAHFYTDEQLDALRRERVQHAQESGVLAPLASAPTYEERLEAARHALDQDPDLAVPALADQRSAIDHERLRPIAELTPLRRTEHNRQAEPNSVLLVSTDTDFFALAVLWFAQLALTSNHDVQYMADHAPLLSIGRRRVVSREWPQDGWIDRPAAQLYTPSTAAQRKKAQEAGEPVPPQESETEFAYELWCIEQLYTNVLRAMHCTDNSSAEQRYNAALSFVTMCGAAGNDYLCGFAQVNRQLQWRALRALAKALGPERPLTSLSIDQTAPQRLDATLPLIWPERYVLYVKYVYYEYMLERGAKADKPTQPVAFMSYEQVAHMVAKKHKSKPEVHPATGKRLELLYERLMWWIAYVSNARFGIAHIRNDSEWGWRPAFVQYHV